MRRWLIQSIVILAIGLGAIAWWWSGQSEATEQGRLWFAVAFLVAAAALIPARTEIQHMKMEKEEKRRLRNRTFE